MRAENLVMGRICAQVQNNLFYSLGVFLYERSFRVNYSKDVGSIASQPNCIFLLILCVLFSIAVSFANLLGFTLECSS